VGAEREFTIRLERDYADSRDIFTELINDTRGRVECALETAT